MNVVVTPEAAADLKAAFEWYEDQRPGLGFEFNRCVDAALMQVARFPAAAPIVDDDVRRILVRRFPYSVFYTQDPDVVVVLAVIHTRRHPTAWRR